MARKITFAEFRDAVAARRQQVVQLAQEGNAEALAALGPLGTFVEFDPDAPLPRLRFREDAFLDEPPAEIDVDKEFYRIVQEAENARDRSKAKDPNKPRVLAEGDSWCYLPSSCPGVPSAIGNRLTNNNLYDCKNIGWYGHTLVRILADRQHLDELTKEETHYFFLSAGGNDLVDQLAAGGVLHDYDPGRPADKYLTSQGHACLNQIEADYNTLLAEVGAKFTRLKTLCFGYDYPRPLVAKGKYIGRHLKKLGIPDSAADSIIQPVVELLGVKIQQAATRNGARYVNCLNVTRDFAWWDDMHPHDDGFNALESKIAQAISGWS